MEGKVTADWRLRNILEIYGEDGRKVLEKHGICVSCIISVDLRIGLIASTRDIEIEPIIDDLNKLKQA
ncbi:MAG: hypothetical protein ACFE68_09050 [Candidatus Hodarchaeota archaeon]